MKCEFLVQRDIISARCDIFVAAGTDRASRILVREQAHHSTRDAGGYRPLVLSAMRVANLLCRPAAFIEQDTLREGRVL
jgi:hypothetical protein